MGNQIIQDSFAVKEYKQNIDSPIGGGVDGHYALIKNGSLIVQHDRHGPYPVVVPCPGIQFIVNGQARYQATPISMQDDVQLVTQDERKEGEWSIEISPDGLQATLRTCPNFVVHREIKDLPPASKLELKIVERKEYSPPLIFSELLQKISQLGITYGIDWQACSAGAASCSEEKIVIARGIPPKPGKDGWVELLFVSESKQAIEVNGEERVDFRNRYFYISVIEGEILAVKHLPEPGLPGTSVKVEVIACPSPRDIILSAGEGVVLDKNCEHAVATRAGRPVAYHGRDMVKISVLPELMHKGDVGLASGNIVFKGDVVIGGNVEDGTVVEAGGNIRIGGLVSGSKIQARESILIKKNILTSTVIAGARPENIQDIFMQVDILATGLREMLIAVNQLIGYPTLKKGVLKYNIGLMLKLLLEGKFNYLFTTAETLKKQADLLSAGLARDRLNALIIKADVLLKTPQQVHDLKEVEGLSTFISEWEQSFVFQASEDNDVVAANILNSTVISSGNIRVEGGGCYNSHIQAGKNVVVSGVFRAGEIQSWGDVYIGELGSRGGTASKVIVGPKAKVSIKNTCENSMVMIGNRTYLFNGKEKNLHLWLDAEGNLQFRTFQANEFDNLA